MCSWYHSNFGSSHSQSIMLCVQAILMMLLPELWIFMLWPPLLLHLIYQSADITSTAEDNCCIHLLWIYAACNCCGYTATTAVVHPKPSLWYFVHCCGYQAASTCCGYTAATAVDIMLHPLAVDILLPLLWTYARLPLLWTCAVNIACH